jgi:hypothetical protein
VRFCLPNSSRTFEIADEWLIEAGFQGFHPNSTVYVSQRSPKQTVIAGDLPVEAILACQVAPPERDTGVRWFDRDRMVHILRGFVDGAPIPPVEVQELRDQHRYKYGVRDGVHRFYASAAAGFDYLPVLIFPYFDIREG